MVIIRRWKEQDIAELTPVANNRKLWDNLLDRHPHPFTENDELAATQSDHIFKVIL